MPSSSPILLIGVGNAWRGDDAVGLSVLRQLKEMNLTGIRLVESTGEAGSLIDLWQNETQVIVIDAVASGMKPGTLHRWDVHKKPLPADFFWTSTHSFGLAQAIDLSRTLNQLPSQLIVYGIEGKKFNYTDTLSPELASAIKKIIPQLREEIDSMQSRG